MKKSLLSSSLICLLSALALLSPAQAWRQSDLRVTFKAPAEVRLDQTTKVPVEVEVTTADGLPFSGQIELWPGYASFEGASTIPFPVQVKEGRVAAVVSLDGKSDWPSPLSISATRGDEVLGQTDVKIRYQEYIEVAACKQTALADGADHPTIRVTIKDQFGQVMEGAQVRVRLRVPGAARTSVPAATGADGAVTLALPASQSPGYATTQVMTDRLASVMVRLLYAEKQPRMVRLRDAADLIGASVSWDETTQTATASAPEMLLEVRPGEQFALLNGEVIPLSCPVALNNGRTELPASFFTEIIGLQI